MSTVTIPAFGEALFHQHRENNTATVTLIPDAALTAFEAYCALLEREGAVKKEAYTENLHRFAAYLQNGTGYFLNYFEGAGELYIVEETATAYFSYADIPQNGVKKPVQFTQIDLSDFGLSDVIRLSDGRFIVIDGGFDKQVDRDALYRCLDLGADGERPRIAAWILTHPHSDHFHCFVGFMKQYGAEVAVEKVLVLFPEADDLVHYPKLDVREGKEHLSGIDWIPRMWETVAACGAAVYTPHTGQRYQIGDAALQVMCSMDDTIHCSKNINASSLVFRMDLCGQVWLLTADAILHKAKAVEKYGTGLKADILQIPHHGFSHSAETDIPAENLVYDTIAAEVCLLPVADYHAFTSFCTYKPATAYQMRHPAVKELIGGTGQRTLTLPYTPAVAGRDELMHRYRAGRAASGANTWIFSDIPVNAPDAFAFTLLNTTYMPATVMVDVYFESKAQVIENQTLTLVGRTLKQARCAADLMDAARLPEALAPDAVFGIRFRSEVPIVVTHRHYVAAYCGEGIG